MADQNWFVPLFDTGGVSGAAVASTTTATSVLPTASVGAGTIGAGYFNKLGKRLRFKCLAQISWTSAAVNFTMTILFGATTVFTTGAIAMLTGTARTNQTLKYEIELTLRAMGSAANLMGVAHFDCCDASTFAVLMPAAIPATAPAVGSNFDARAAQQIDHQITWGTSSASNSFTLIDFVCEGTN
jgi:hypothetical protein